MKPPLTLVLARLAALLLLTAVAARAVVIPLTGGDPGEGFAPLASTFAAVDTGGPGGLAVQGVLFTASNPNIALSTVSPSGVFSGPPFGSTTTNDANLITIGNTAVFNNPGPITLSISGLTPGTLYQVDSFIRIGTDFLTRVEQVSAVGLTTATDSQSLGIGGFGNGLLYDVRQSLLPSLAGQIVVTYSITSGFSAPILNAISVTAAPAAVPEPGTALAGVGLVALCGSIRRRRAG